MDWAEQAKVMLVPCAGCLSMWQPDESCPICNDVDLSEANEEAVCQQESKVISQ